MDYRIGPRPTVAYAGLALAAVAGIQTTTGHLRAMDDPPASQPHEPSQPHPEMAGPARPAAEAAAHPSTSAHHRQAGPGR